MTVRETLLEREYAGLRVEIVLLDEGGIALKLQDSQSTRLKPIPGEAAFDAFHHPYCYLAPDNEVVQPGHSVKVK